MRKMLWIWYHNLLLDSCVLKVSGYVMFCFNHKPPCSINWTSNIPNMPIPSWNKMLLIRIVIKSFLSAAAANPDLPTCSWGNKPSMPRMDTFDRHWCWFGWKTVFIFSGNMNMNMIIFDVIYMNQVVNIDIIIFISIYPINLAIKCNQQNKQCLLNVISS